jgi:hypothetical protein
VLLLVDKHAWESGLSLHLLGVLALLLENKLINVKRGRGRTGIGANGLHREGAPHHTGAQKRRHEVGKGKGDCCGRRVKEKLYKARSALAESILEQNTKKDFGMIVI